MGSEGNQPPSGSRSAGVFGRRIERRFPRRPDSQEYGRVATVGQEMPDPFTLLAVDRSIPWSAERASVTSTGFGLLWVLRPPVAPLYVSRAQPIPAHARTGRALHSTT